MVIQQLLLSNDLEAALPWFNDFLPDSPKKHPSVPQLDFLAYQHLLHHATKTADWNLYDRVLFAALTFSPTGFQPRPIDISQGIDLHLRQITPDSLAEDVKKHTDRILGLITKCEQYRQMEYIVPPTLSPSLLSSLTKVKNFSVFRDVYRRALLHFDPKSTEAFQFQDRMFATIVHLLTSEQGVLAEYTIKERLEFIGSLVEVGVSLHVPLNVSNTGVGERVLGLYADGIRETEGRFHELGLSTPTAWVIMECAATEDLRLFSQVGQASNTISFVSAIINAKRATGVAYQLNWASAANTLVDCHGVEYASRLLALLGPDILPMLGLPSLQAYGPGSASALSEEFIYKLFENLNPAERAVEASVDVDGEATSSAGKLQASAPVFVPGSAAHTTASTAPPLVRLHKSPLEATAPIAETVEPPTEEESALPTFSSPNAGLSERVFRVDPTLSRVVDLYRTAANKVTPLESYHALKAGLAKDNVAHFNTLGHLVSALGRLKDKDKAAEVLELAHHVLYLLKPQDLQSWIKLESQAIIAFAHCGEMDRASFHRTNIIQAGGAPSADAYAALVNGAKDTTDDAAVARALFREAKELNVKPNLFFYNTIISSLSKARKAEEAITLFYEMKEQGLKPSTVTYGAVIVSPAQTYLIGLKR